MTMVQPVKKLDLHAGDNYLADRVKQELMIFWGTHPNSKFSLAVICYALDFNKSLVEKQIKEMVRSGLLMEHIENGKILYSLTLEENKRKPISQYAERRSYW